MFQGFKNYIAKVLLCWSFGGVPKLPKTFDQPIQGPLSRDMVIKYMRRNIVERCPYLDNERIDRFLEPDRFTGNSRVSQLAFALDTWTDDSMSLEEYLDSEMFEGNKRRKTNGFEGDYFLEGNFLGGNSQKALRDLVYRNKERPSDEGANQYPNEKPIELIEKMECKNFNGHWIRHSSFDTRSDREVLLKSMEKSGYGWPIIDMSEEIQLDTEIVKKVMENNPTDICYIRPEMLDNLEVMEVVVRHPVYANCIRYASARVKNDYRLALIGLRYKTGEKTRFNCFGDRIRDDDRLFLMAYPDSWFGASKRLREKYWYLKV